MTNKKMRKMMNTIRLVENEELPMPENSIKFGKPVSDYYWWRVLQSLGDPSKAENNRMYGDRYPILFACAEEKEYYLKLLKDMGVPINDIDEVDDIPKEDS